MWGNRGNDDDQDGPEATTTASSALPFDSSGYTMTVSGQNGSVMFSNTGSSSGSSITDPIPLGLNEFHTLTVMPDSDMDTMDGDASQSQSPPAPMSGLMIRLEALVPDDPTRLPPSFEIGSTLLIPSTSCELFYDSTRVQGMETRPSTQNSWAVAWIWSGTPMIVQVDVTMVLDLEQQQVYHSTYYISYGGAQLLLEDEEDENEEDNDVLGRNDEDEDDEVQVPTVAPTTTTTTDEPTASPSQETMEPTGLMDKLQQVIMENDPPAAAALGIGSPTTTNEPTTTIADGGVLVNVPSPTDTMTASPTISSSSDMPSDMPSIVPSIAPSVEETTSNANAGTTTTFPPGVLINQPAPPGFSSGSSSSSNANNNNYGYGGNYGSNYGYGGYGNYGGSSSDDASAPVSEETDGRVTVPGSGSSTTPGFGGPFDSLMNFFGPSGPFGPSSSQQDEDDVDEEIEDASGYGNNYGYGNYGYGGGYGGYSQYGGGYGGSYGQYGYGTRRSNRRNLRQRSSLRESGQGRTRRVSVARHAQEMFWQHEQEQHRHKHQHTPRDE